MHEFVGILENLGVKFATERVKSGIAFLSLLVTCQTNHTSDVPYLISEELPPIFGSQFCQKSRAVNFLSGSLPDLSIFSWVKITDEDILRDEAEQALNAQYDRKVEDFYEEAKRTASKLHEIYEEGVLAKLFQTE